MELNIQLAEVFLESPGGVFSIHQISKKLDIPYGTAYNRIHLLGKMGVVRIIPQGKAKLCALNPPHPMTPTLLALGASTATARFFDQPSPLANIARKVRDFLDDRFRDSLHCAILLNAETLLTHSEEELMNIAVSSIQHLQDDAGGEDGQTPVISLDLFLIMTGGEPELDRFDADLLSTLSTQFPLRITKMVVTPSTLLGMIHEKENDAGLSAYHMLRRGVILCGFDRFFSLVLKTFGGFGG
jgi:hypothetical protein